MWSDEHITVDYLKYIQIPELTDTSIDELIGLFEQIISVLGVKGEILKV